MNFYIENYTDILNYIKQYKSKLYDKGFDFIKVKDDLYYFSNNKGIYLRYKFLFLETKVLNLFVYSEYKLDKISKYAQDFYKPKIKFIIKLNLFICNLSSYLSCIIST